MKKLLTRTGIVIALFLPTLAFAAYNDVTLTTDVVLSVNSVSINVSGSSATVDYCRRRYHLYRYTAVCFHHDH